MQIRPQTKAHLAYFTLFGLSSIFIFWYYLSNTIVHYTSDRQFPINSLFKYPLSIPIFVAEAFSFAFALYFLYCLFSDARRPAPPKPLADKPPVAFCLPVYNEPADVVDRTLYAIHKVRWPKKVIYLLDDSKGDKEMAEMAQLAKKHGAVLVRRSDRVGYKAGNINNGVRTAVKEDFFVILDSDQAPLPEFLERTMDNFSDPAVFFVQTPQYFVNDDTPVRRAAKIGSNIFYQAMCVAKAKDHALPFCGTNLIVRARMFRELKGFSYYTSTEDIELGLRADARGWHGAYVPEVLVQGYAPPDWRAYQSQQYRWANGNLAILRNSWKELIWGEYSFLYQVHTFFTVAWWFIGITTFLYILVPILSLLLHMPTHHMWLPSWVLPILYINVVLGIGMIYVALHDRVEDDKITIFDAFVQYSVIVNSMFLYGTAAINAMLKRYIGFVRTDKEGSATGLKDIKWNLTLSAICFLVSVYALYFVCTASTIEQVRTYLPISMWLLFYSVILFSSILLVDDQPTSASSSATKKAPIAEKSPPQIMTDSHSANHHGPKSNDGVSRHGTRTGALLSAAAATTEYREQRAPLAKQNSSGGTS